MDLHLILMAFWSLLAVGSLLFSRRVFGHALSPFGVFYAVWFGALSLLNLRWIEYEPIKPFTWMIIVLNLASFAFGWVAACAFFLPLPNKKCSERLSVEKISSERMRRVIYTCFVLGMIGLGQFLWQVQNTTGITAYWEAPSDVRAAMGTGELVEGLKLLNWLNVANIVFCVLYLKVLKGKSPRPILLILLVSVLALLFMEDRTRFFFAVLWLTFVLLFSVQWKTKAVLRGVAIVSGLLFVQFLGIAIWLGKVAQNNPELLDSVSVSDSVLVFVNPYMYLTASFPALGAYIESTPERTYGTMTFYPLYKALLFLDPTPRVPSIVADFYDIPFPYNTFTWLHQFYTDFGVAGVILGPLAVGCLAGCVYFSMLRRKNFYLVYLNGLISFALVLSILVNHLTQGPVWYFITIGYIIHRYIDIRAGHVPSTVGSQPAAV